MNDEDAKGLGRFLANTGDVRGELQRRHREDELVRAFLDAQDALTALAAELESDAIAAHGPRVRDHAKTVRRVTRHVAGAFADLGVVSMPGAGEFVDLTCQEVVETRPSDQEEDSILEVIVQGYHRQGRPLRLGKVVVALGSMARGNSQEDDK